MKFRNVSTEDEENVEADTSAIDEVLEKYEEIKNMCNDHFKEELDLPILKPAQINLFFQTAIDKAIDSNELWSEKNYEFLNWLIFNSWSCGYNDFKLNNQKDYEFNHLLGGLKGDRENPISITFKGKGGYNFALGSMNCIYNINDFETGFSSNSTNCTYNIHKEVKTLFNSSYFSNTYNFFKKTKSIGNINGNRVQECIFNFYEGIDEIKWGSISNCTFRTQDLETYEKLASSLRNRFDYLNFWNETIRKSFVDKSKIIEERFFYKSGNCDPLTYNKIQLIK